MSRTRQLFEAMVDTVPPARVNAPVLGPLQAVIGGRRVPLREEIVFETPFAQLIRFATGDAQARPSLLLVAPLSGMGPRMLCDMVVGLVEHHDLHVLAWRDAAEIPCMHGDFGLDDDIAAVREAIIRLGPGLHVAGLCQSALPCLAATALLAAEPSPFAPATLTLIAGKLDPRIAPTAIDRRVRSRPRGWYKRHVITTVPAGRPGAGRRVYPAGAELMLIVAYFARHLSSGGEVAAKALRDDGCDPRGHPFRNLLFSTVNVPAEFFLDTVETVFHRSALARGELVWRGVAVDPGAIADTALLTIEGDADDIAAPGQTRVAHDLCRRIPAHRRDHLLCLATGHFGLFHGATWRMSVLPHIRHFIREAAAGAGQAGCLPAAGEPGQRTAYPLGIA